MNSQPYGSPDRHWPPRLNAWWFYALHGHRQRKLRRQQMTLLEFEGLHHLAQAGRKGLGLIEHKLARSAVARLHTDGVILVGKEQYQDCCHGN